MKYKLTPVPVVAILALGYYFWLLFTEKPVHNIEIPVQGIAVLLPYVLGAFIVAIAADFFFQYLINRFFKQRYALLYIIESLMIAACCVVLYKTCRTEHVARKPLTIIVPDSYQGFVLLVNNGNAQPERYDKETKEIHIPASGVFIGHYPLEAYTKFGYVIKNESGQTVPEQRDAYAVETPNAWFAEKKKTSGKKFIEGRKNAYAVKVWYIGAVPLNNAEPWENSPALKLQLEKKIDTALTWIER